jgi:putative endonuclease
VWRFLQSLLSPAQPADTGALGERSAAAWLRRERRFCMVASNWRNPRDRREEIDLVGRDGDALVFVEVKTRAPGALVPGYYAVNARKRRVLQRAIRSYLKQLREKPRTFRFDIVEVVLPRGAESPLEILHFENVPLFPKGFRGGGG